MYAIVRAGGRQEKVSVGDVVTVDRLAGSPGDSVALRPVLVVDGTTVTSAADELAKITVHAQIIDDLRGPKIRVIKFKNKTGYRRHQGHRQELTRIKIDSIGK
ncbi:MAG: 50S ribosomal protein L21 [Actinomycetales bacterium]